MMLTKTNTYVTGYNGQAYWMYFLIEDNDLWGKYNATWYKDSVDIKKIW